jgi:Fe(3+) dicitrate transport protein
VTPGVRFEYISTASDGYYRLLNKNLAGTILLDKKIADNRSNTRSFALMGIGTQYKFSQALELYANFSQNYRSVNFNDMRVVNPNFQVDPQLKDEKGFTADGGLRGVIKDLLYFDLSVFMLQYNGRIGTALKVDSSTYQLVRFRTNIGNSRNIGVESFAELDWMKLINKKSNHKIATFINFSAIDARYISKDKTYDNKLVEYVPGMIVRTGITYGYKKFTFTYQYSYTSKQYSDATNAETSPSAIYGAIPAYSVMDFSASYTYRIFGINAGINNVANSKYFTRRAEGYPGPGIIPADPFNIYVTARVKF